MAAKTKLLVPWSAIVGLVVAAGSLVPGVTPSRLAPSLSLGTLEKTICPAESSANGVEHPAPLVSFGETIQGDHETTRAKRDPQAPASVTIAGPAETSPGDLVILEARGEYEGIRWILGNSTKSFLPVDDGRRCVFASGAPGEYRFFAVVAQRDGEATTLADASFVVRVGGPSPVPPTPTPPTPTPPPAPTPIPPAPTPTPPPAPIPDSFSSLSLVVIRDVDDLTADQAEVLLNLRTWSDAQPPAKVRHYEFAPDQKNELGQTDPVVAGYLAKKPATAKLPYVLLLATDATPAKVAWQGELPATAKEITDRMSSLLKPGRPKVSAKE